MTRPPQLHARRVVLDGGRYYVVGGTLYVSVTTVLSVLAKPNLAAWSRRTALNTARQLIEGGLPPAEALELAEREPKRVRDGAARRGTAVHEAIAAALAGRPYPHEHRPRVRAALAFLRDRGLALMAGERLLVSHRHRFAGTCDVATMRGAGRLALVDWKTGGIWPEHALQLGAYAIALEEMTGRPVAVAWVVSLKDGQAEARAVNLRQAGAAFLAALELWRATRGGLWVDGDDGDTKPKIASFGHPKGATTGRKRPLIGGKWTPTPHPHRPTLLLRPHQSP